MPKPKKTSNPRKLRIDNTEMIKNLKQLGLPFPTMRSTIKFHVIVNCKMGHQSLLLGQLPETN